MLSNAAFERCRHLLHVIPSFAVGGAQVRIVQVLNHLGNRCQHTIVALDGNFAAATRIREGIFVSQRCCRSSTNPLLMAARFRTLMQETRPDLILTYNWGALDAITATLLTPGVRVVHTEDGFGAEEAERQIQRRMLFRRMLLPRAETVVAPSQVLAGIMVKQWRLRESSIAYIPNGVDTDRFSPARKKSSSNSTIIGTAANLRPEKQLELLLETFASIAPTRNIRLHIAGDGSERPKLEKRARDLAIDDRVTFCGHLDDLPGFYRSLDIFALTSSTEQMPLSVLEAMATGLPVLSTDVGDVKNMVSAGNRPFVVPVHGLSKAMTILLEQPLRVELGAANRLHCLAHFQLSKMLRTYEDLYFRL